MGWNLRDKFENISESNKIISFIIITTLTIFVTRMFTLISNPNPMIAGFELHHFDYGLFLLMLTSLLVIFGTKKHYSHMILFGISFGWIIDDIWFIRSNILDPSTNELIIYNSTLAPTILITITLIVAILAIKHSAKKFGTFEI